MAPRKKKLTPKLRNPPGLLSKIQNENMGPSATAFANGLQEALLGCNTFGSPYNNGSIGTQLQQTTTMYINLRWYLVSNFRQLLSQVYAEKGLIQTVCDVPCDDAFRGGVDIKTKQLEADEIEDIKAIMDEQDDLVILAQTMKWNRLFGGAGTLVLTDQDPMTPLDLTKIKESTPVELRALDMWELFWTKQNTSDYAAAIDEQNLEDVEFYNYYGTQVHKSRVWKKKGIIAPSFIRPRLRGWGLSVVESIIDSLNQYLKSQNVIFEVMDEFKVDVYKIKNLAATLLNPAGTAAVQTRIQIANQQKDFQNALTLDSEDDYIQKQLVFSGIADTLTGIRMALASELRMPVSKIFGIGATGFSSGEDDIENYNAMVESQVRQKAKFDVVKIVKIRCQQRFGFMPDDLTIEFKPLRVLSSEQEENVKEKRFARLFSNWQAGGMTTEEYKDAVNKYNLMGVQLDTSIEELPPLSSGGDEGAASGKKSVTEAPEAKA